MNEMDLRQGINMTIEKRRFGRTGHMSSAVLFGGAALGKSDQDEADQVLDLLFEFGINHIDTAPDYGDSELRIGPWMKKHRKDFFLATKTRERSYQKAREQIRRSLDRLCTDQLDLIQLHALIHPDEWEQALSSGGALEAAIEAREEGLVRFIGVTGNPDKTDEPLFPGLNRSLQGTSRRKSLLPFVGMDQRMKLDQVQLVRTEPVEGPADLFSGFLVGTFSGFGGKKKILPVFFHPWTDSQFRISIIRCRINVIDAEFEQ